MPHFRGIIGTHPPHDVNTKYTRDQPGCHGACTSNTCTRNVPSALGFLAPRKYPNQAPRQPQFSSNAPLATKPSPSKTRANAHRAPWWPKSHRSAPACRPGLRSTPRAFRAHRFTPGPLAPSAWFPTSPLTRTRNPTSSEWWSGIPALASFAVGYSSRAVPGPAVPPLWASSHFPRRFSPSRKSAGIRAGLPVLPGWGPGVGGRRPAPRLSRWSWSAPPCAAALRSAPPRLCFLPGSGPSPYVPLPPCPRRAQLRPSPSARDSGPAPNAFLASQSSAARARPSRYALGLQRAPALAGPRRRRASRGL